MKKKIYISIPITGLPMQKVRERADLLKARLSRDGWQVVSPLDIYAGEKPEYADYICSDLRAMFDCDAIYFCRGWNLSCGCKIEHAVAVQMNGHPILNGQPNKRYRIIYEENYNPKVV